MMKTELKKTTRTHLIHRLNTTAFSRVLFAAVVLSGSSNLFAAPSSPNSVAVFLSAPESKVNVSTLEFYRAVSDEIFQTKTWPMVDGNEIRRAGSINGSKFLGQVPVLPREFLLKSHPDAAIYFFSPGATRKKLSDRQKLIPSVQETLDTLAIQGAVIVDCQTDADGSGFEKLRGCGLYYYDRGAGKIVAASRKSFRVGVVTANKWSGSMVEGLKSGLDNHKARQDRERLSSIVEKNEEKDGPARPYLTMGLIGESMRLKGGDSANLAGGIASFGAGYSGRSLGLEYSHTTFKGEHALSKARLQSRSANLVLGVSAEAMDIVTWSLDITAGVSDRRFWQEEEETLRATQPIIGVRPGIFWKIRKGWLMGATVAYRSTYGGEEKVVVKISTDEKKMASGFNSVSWLTGISTRVEF